MPDWISHIIFSLILARILRIKRKSLIVLGAILPDILIKFYLLSIFLPVDRYLIQSFFFQFHTPLGLALLSVIILPLFNMKKTQVYLQLLVGWSSHLLLDLTNKHMIIGENQLLFPFSWKNFELGLLWPNQYWVVLLILIMVYSLILLIDVIKENKRPKMIRMILCNLGKLLFIFKKMEMDLRKVKNILIIRSGAIGDVLMATPFVKSVRKNFPNAKISFLVGDWSISVLKNNPNIDKIISFDDKIIFKKKMLKIVGLILKVRKKRFDLCFILDKSFHWNLFAFFSKCKNRVGFDRYGEGFPNNVNIKFDGSKYELEYNLDLLRKVNINIISDKMELFPSKKDLIFSKKLLLEFNGKLIGISPSAAKNPGQEMGIKRWPKESYIELIRRLLTDNINIKIILFGGKTDYEIGSYIQNSVNNKNLINLIGKTNVQQSYLIMKKCNLFITHDSGPLHIAAASDTKIIALFGPTSPRRFAPKNSYVICKGKPAYDVYGHFTDKKLMQKIRVDEVYKKVKKIGNI